MTQNIDNLSNEIDKLNLSSLSNNLKLLILYAGETGNCEDVAKRIGWQAISKGFEIVVNQFDDYQIGKLVKEEYVIFICSTTNQGDEPEPIKNFWKFIMRKGLPDNVLNNLKCGVIGLGDSSYLHYNVVGKKLFKRLKQLGAGMLLDLCLGDDQHDLGLDAAVDKWLPEFWNSIEKNLNLKFNTTNNKLSFKLYDVELIDNELIKMEENKEDKHNVEYNHLNYYSSKVISNKKLTSDDHFQETKLIKLDLSESDNNLSLKFKPSDIVMILPENSKESVDEFINLLNLNDNRNQLIKLKRINKQFLSSNLLDTIENKPIKLEQLIREYLDLNSVPKRSFFEILSTYSTDQLEHDKLKEFSSTNGQYALYEYCKNPKRSILEVLIDFPKTTSNLKIQDLVQLINPITPRPYSIANSLTEHPNQLHVLYAVKKKQTLLKKIRLGLCSNYLKNLNKDDNLLIYVKKGTLKMPNNKLPLIMIGPGTGVAPFRSIIQERINLNQASNFLFFGCRSKNKDFYFKDEWLDYSSRGLLYYYVAFSRDQEHKIYVQDKLWENRKLIWELLSKCDAHIIVCGSSVQMPKDVREMLIKILKDQGGNELKLDNNAEIVINKFEATKKLQFECWD